MNPTILLVDDDPQLLLAAQMVLLGAGRYEVVTLTDSREVIPWLGSARADVVVVDLEMPHLSGQSLLQELTTHHPDIPVLVMTGTDDLETAVACMKIGAVDYLVKPVDPDRLVSAVNRALEMRGLRTDVVRLKDSMLATPEDVHPAFADIITHSGRMLKIFQYLQVVAPSPLPVLITGESGTGKELMARAIHGLTKRAGSFVAINVAGMDDATFTATLFGYGASAFPMSGVNRASDGLLMGAGAGTVFLDEIGDLTIPSQVKLLQLLQDGTFYPVGSDQPRQSPARFVVATNRDVKSDMNAGRLRRNLYHLLQRQHVHLPPLRERFADLPLLVAHFLDKAAAAQRRRAPAVPLALYELLGAYRFPGNVGELEAMCHDAMARHRGNVLALRSFKSAINANQGDGAPSTSGNDAAPASWLADQLPTLREARFALVDEAMRRAHNNQGVAAALLRMDRRALNAILKRREKARKVPTLPRKAPSLQLVKGSTKPRKIPSPMSGSKRPED